MYLTIERLCNNTEEHLSHSEYAKSAAASGHALNVTKSSTIQSHIFFFRSMAFMALPSALLQSLIHFFCHQVPPVLVSPLYYITHIFRDGITFLACTQEDTQPLLCLEVRLT